MSAGPVRACTVAVLACLFLGVSCAASEAPASPDAGDVDPRDPNDTVDDTGDDTGRPDAPDDSPSDSEDAMAACRILGGCGLQLVHEQTPRNACIVRCSELGTTNPFRTCEWGNEVVVQLATDQCAVAGQDGTEAFADVTTRCRCLRECSDRELTLPDRTCVWSGESLR